MKREKIDVLKDEVKIPDIVMEAAEDAFSQIAREASGTDKMGIASKCQKNDTDKFSFAKKNNKEIEMPIKKKSGFKKKWVAAAMVAVLAVATLTVGAATDFQWFKAYTEALEISEEDKALIEKYSMGDSIDQSVTDNDITITLEEYICDRNAAYVIYSIEGIDAPTEGQTLRLGGDGTHAGRVVNKSMQYLGQDADTGKLLYMESILTSATGNMASGYMFSNFTSVEIWEDTMAARTASWSAEGEWNFKVQLAENTAVTNYTAEFSLQGKDAVLKEVTLSPISIKYTVEYDGDYYYGARESKDWDAYEVDCYGFKMKDGSIEAIMGGGYGQNRLVSTSGCHFGKVINVEQIESLLFRNNTYDASDDITLEDFVEVPLAELQLVE